MSKLGAFIAGLGGGYIKAADKEYERDRQAKADARADRLEALQTEQFGWARDAAAAAQRERANKEALDKAVTEGMEVGSPKSAAAVTYTDADGTKRTAYQPDMAAAQAAAETQRLEEALSPGLTPSAPQAQPATAVRTLSGGRGLYVGPTASDDAAKFAAQNPSSDYDKYMALSKRLAAMAGGQEKADAYLKRAKEAEKEGAFRALTLLDAGDPDGAVKAWNSTGARRLEPGQRLVTVTDKQGSKIHQVVNADGSLAVPDVEKSLVRYLSGIEGITSEVKARNDARAKFSEEVYKPRVLKPGETFGAINPTTGQWQQFGVGSIPAGFQPVERNGETVLERIPGAAGAGKGGKAAPAFGDINDVFKAVEGFSNIKTELSGQQGVEALRLARLFSTQQPGVDASAAAAAALRAAQDPTQIKPTFDPKTGKIMAGVQFEGGSFFVRPLGTPGKPGTVKPEEMKAIASGYIASLPDEKKSILLPAAFSKDGRAKLSETVAADVRSPEGIAQLQTFLGRKPTEADIATAIKSVESTTQQALDLIALHGDPALRKQFGEKPAPAPKAAPAGGVTPAGTAPAQTQGFGLGGAPMSQADRRKLVDTKVAEMRAAEADRVAALQKSAPEEAARLLADNTPQSRVALAKLQASEGFKYLDEVTKLAVWKRVNQGR